MWKWEAEGEAKAVIVMVHGAMEHHGRYGCQSFLFHGFTLLFSAYSDFVIFYLLLYVVYEVPSQKSG